MATVTVAIEVATLEEIAVLTLAMAVVMAVVVVAAGDLAATDLEVCFFCLYYQH